MSKEKDSQKLFDCIIKVFKEIIETLSKMVSNKRMRKENQEKEGTILKTDSGDKIRNNSYTKNHL